MANEILRSVNVADDGHEVPAKEIASRIEAILLAAPDEEAFKLASVNTEERHGFIDQVARQVRDAVLTAYTVTEIEREQNPPPVKETNGWMSMNASSRMRSRGINGGTPGPETKAMTLSAMTALPVLGAYSGSIMRCNLRNGSGLWSICRLSGRNAGALRRVGSGPPERPPVEPKNVMKPS
jgi:hypothetical protein